MIVMVVENKKDKNCENDRKCGETGRFVNGGAKPAQPEVGRDMWLGQVAILESRRYLVLRLNLWRFNVAETHCGTFVDQLV